jgi:hypothetical protein
MFAALELDDPQLGAPAVGRDLGLYPRALQDRAPDLDAITVHDHEDVGEIDPGTHVTREFFDPQGRFRRDLVLFTAALDDRVHG